MRSARAEEEQGHHLHRAYALSRETKGTTSPSSRRSQYQRRLSRDDDDDDDDGKNKTTTKKEKIKSDADIFFLD